MSLAYRIVPTAAGHVGLVAGPDGLRRVLLPERTAAAARRGVLTEFPDAAADDELLPDLARALVRYFAGEAVDFDVPLDFAAAGPFARRVWDACRRIGYGRTSTYAALARAAGRPGAARAVGGAMGRNPFPIIVPCHRVLRSDGGLGGYSGPLGIGFKRRLLDLEAAAAAGAQSREA